MADPVLAAQLKRLDAGTTLVSPGFDYDSLLQRHEESRRRAHRRLTLARGTAAAVMLALIGASLWRLEQGGEPAEVRATVTAETAAGTAPLTAPAEPRIVRADSWLAVAVLEDHIASLDDALNYARISGGPAEVARLERTRAELFASYSQLRYAERVSANF